MRGERIVVQDVETSAIFAGTASLPVMRTAGVRAVQSTPLVTRGGRLLGILTTHWATPHSPDQHNLWRLDLLARQAADLIEQKQSETALAAAKQRLEAHVDNSPMAVIEFDPAFRIVRWSREAERLFGWTAAEVTGRAIAELRWVHEDDVERVRQVSSEMLTGHRPRNLHVNRNYRNDGTVVLCEWYNSALYDAEGGLTSIFSQVLDITARTQAEEALRDANAALAEADRRKDEFIAILSHELRNPLAPIRYALPVLGAQKLDEAGGRAMAVVSRQLDLLVRLVDDLLDVSRITRGKIELRREPATVAAIVSTAIEAASPEIAAARHSLEVVVPEEPIWVRADRARIAQVITNLLNNAAKYTPRGGRVRLEASHENGSAIIRVQDNGMGISSEALPTVFEMFRQVKAPQRGCRAGDPAGAPDLSQGGLGIGLALVRQLVDMHGGTIEAHSGGLGQGAEFIVRLPVSDPACARECMEGATDATTGGQRLRVLVVDDNADLVEMLAMVVEAAGHDVRKAFDGRTAISAATAYHPDVVLLDLGLPVISGIDVARQLRQQPETAHALLVALTGWGQAEDRARTREAGFGHHLTKPADPKAVADLLTRLATEKA